MCVTPVAELFVFTKVLRSDVKTADVPDLPVNRTKFPVIAVVDPQVEDAERRSEKRPDFSAVLVEGSEVLRFEFPGADRIIENALTTKPKQVIHKNLSHSSQQQILKQVF